MSSDRLTRNALMVVVQVIISGIVLFLLFRYLLKTIGSEMIGIWAVVMATASATRISEMGFSGSAVKFTAKYISRGEMEKAAAVIQTTAISVGVLLACVLAGGYLFIAWLVGKIISGIHVLGAMEILPYALGTVWIGAVAGVLMSGLDGCQRIDLRVLVSILASMLLLVLTWLLVPAHGLIGVAFAQIGQGMLMLIMSWVLLRRQFPSLPILPLNWSYSLFREMFQYGLNLQVISMVGMLFEPTTKALMAKFGGMTSTAYYEMANRMVMQFRALLISAYQVMVPQIASLQESGPEEIKKIYLGSYRIMLFLALTLYVGVAAVSPLVSELWIGHYELSFVGYTLLLSAGFWFNTLMGPAYFTNLGMGSLRWNTWAHIAIGILNIVLGYGLGVTFGGMGVVLGYIMALVIGSCTLIMGFHRDNHIVLAELFPAESRTLVLVSCAALTLGWGVSHLLGEFTGGLLKAMIILATCMVPIGVVFWRHPLQPKISEKIAAALGRHACKK